ncbi:MAG TPA: D-alanyl-D-alanine carboxypeptidase family protein [Alcanivoracaceae bacterium]|nr:D-alanyl-D-alanine carboxypeptidase family protein [Alcanivoracaceae bacterium]
MISVFKQHCKTLLFTSFLSLPLTAMAALPSAPTINAKGHILIEAATGHVITEENADEQLPPASLTKIMTDYIAAYEVETGRLQLDEPVNVSVKAWRMGGSRMFIKEGTQVPLEDILRGIVIQSGNDAAVALAEHIAGSEGAFADIMNEHARRLGMKNSNFENATGWPDEAQYSSPRDMAILARALIQEYPDNYKLYSEKYFTYGGIRQPNRNLLLWQDSSVDGVKTGHTDAAGYSLVASAERDGLRLISVVMGASSEQARANESQKLLRYGFRNFDSYSPFTTEDTVTTVKVWLGNQDTATLGIAEPFSIIIPKGSEESLSIDINIDKHLRAPFNKGDVLGELNIKLEDKVLATTALVAQQDVEKGGIFKRLWHHLVLLVTGFF